VLLGRLSLLFLSTYPYKALATMGSLCSKDDANTSAERQAEPVRSCCSFPVVSCCHLSLMPFSRVPITNSTSLANPGDLLKQRDREVESPLVTSIDWESRCV